MGGCGSEESVCGLEGATQRTHGWWECSVPQPYQCQFLSWDIVIFQDIANKENWGKGI